MIRYLNKFSTHDDYKNQVIGVGVTSPNVSYCTNNNITHYTPYFCKATLIDGSVINIQGKGTFAKSSWTNIQRNNCVKAELGYLCSSIGYEAFRDAQNLTDVTMLDSVTSIGEGAFKFCRTKLTNVTIPNSVTIIGKSAFQEDKGIKSIILPSGLTTIENDLFLQCSSLSSVTIPSNITRIGNTAFYGCSIETINIPSSITTIGYAAFKYCTKLKIATIHAVTPPSISTEVFNWTHNNIKIYVPSESVEAYKAATNWSAYASSIEPIPTE